MNIDERFWSKVDKKSSEECWEWLANRKDNGYGNFYYLDKCIGAHVVSWALSNNRGISEIVNNRKLIVCHKCDNPSCCNPNHLYLGSYSDNRRDAGNRHPVPAEIAGVSNAKFHSDEIHSIRKLMAIQRKGIQTTYNPSASSVAKIFKTTHSVILNIWKADKWLCKEGYYV
jgi:hypothetical protein